MVEENTDTLFNEAHEEMHKEIEKRYSNPKSLEKAKMRLQKINERYSKLSESMKKVKHLKKVYENKVKRLSE